LSFAGLERLRFGDASPEAATLARATLAALALVGDRLTFARPSLWLRSGCDLVRVGETVAFEQADGESEQVTVSAAEAIEAFLTLRRRTTEAGVPMDTDVVAVTPISALAAGIRHAGAQAVPDGK
jgi:CRISPR-associated protein Csb1